MDSGTPPTVGASVAGSGGTTVSMSAAASRSPSPSVACPLEDAQIAHTEIPRDAAWSADGRLFAWFADGDGGLVLVLCVAQQVPPATRIVDLAQTPVGTWHGELHIAAGAGYEMWVCTPERACLVTHGAYPVRRCVDPWEVVADPQEAALLRAIGWVPVLTAGHGTITYTLHRAPANPAMWYCATRCETTGARNGRPWQGTLRDGALTVPTAKFDGVRGESIIVDLPSLALCVAGSTSAAPPCAATAAAPSPKRTDRRKLVPPKRMAVGAARALATAALRDAIS